MWPPRRKLESGGGIMRYGWTKIQIKMCEFMLKVKYYAQIMRVFPLHGTPKKGAKPHKIIFKLISDLPHVSKIEVAKDSCVLVCMAEFN